VNAQALLPDAETDQTIAASHLNPAGVKRQNRAAPREYRA